MDFNDRLLSVGGQASYTIASILGMISPQQYGVNYYVDGNASASGQGNSWESPYNSLAEALLASSAELALSANRHWARRNAIWLVADDMVEDLDLLTQKTDIIGCGSSDVYSMACVRGNHVPIAAAGLGMGSRFINVRFRPTASEDLFTLDSTIQAEFYGCLFGAHYGAFVAPSAIDTTASKFLKVIGCEFNGQFSSNYIDIGAGRIDQMRILGNTMMGSAVNGVMVTGAATMVQSLYGLIMDNFIQCPGITIDDGDNDVFLTARNTCLSAAATGTASIDVDSELSVLNYVKDATQCSWWPRDDTT